MALRAALDIDVNDIALQRALATLQKFKQEAGAVSVTPGVGPGRPGIRPGGGTDGQTGERAVSNAERLARAWGTMRDHSREVVRNVREMSQRFLSLTGWMSLLTGAATGFGFLGFNALAGGAANLRQQAIGAGTTIGGLQSSRIGLGRFANIDALLPRLREAVQTPGSAGWQALQLLNQVQRPGEQFEMRPGMDTAELTPGVMRAFQRFMQRTPENQRGLMFEQLKMGNIFGSFQEAQQLIGRTPEELETQIGRTRGMQRGLQVTDDDARKFQDFTATIDQAGATIKTTLINQIVALAGPLGQLTEKVTALLQSFIRWALSAPNVQAMSDAITRFTKFLGEHDFEADWKSVKTAFDEVTQAVKDFADFIKGVINFFSFKTLPGAGAGTVAPPKPLDQQQGTLPSQGGWGWDSETKSWRRFQGTEDNQPAAPPNPLFMRKTPGDITAPDMFTPTAFRGGVGGRGLPIMANAPIPVEITGFRGFGEKKQEQPAEQPPPWAGMLQMASFRGGMGDNDNADMGGLLARVAKAESGWNPNAVSPRGAMGLMQFMPETWKMYGHGSPFDPAESMAAAQRYLGKLLGQFGGDTSKALAGYNWGEGNVEQAIKQFGNDWLAHAPPETQKYVGGIMGNQQAPRRDFHPARPPSVNVTINNEAGGNLTTASRMMA
jgi:hypothetical protein